MPRPRQRNIYYATRSSGEASVGPAGPEGPMGPTGPAGADGATGPAGADGASSVAYPVTVTTANVRDVEYTVAHVGMVSSSIIKAFIKAGLDSDENNADMMPEATVSAMAGTDTVTIILTSTIPMSGPVNIVYEVLP